MFLSLPFFGHFGEFEPFDSTVYHVDIFSLASLPVGLPVYNSTFSDPVLFSTNDTIKHAFFGTKIHFSPRKLYFWRIETSKHNDLDPYNSVVTEFAINSANTPRQTHSSTTQGFLLIPHFRDFTIKPLASRFPSSSVCLLSAAGPTVPLLVPGNLCHSFVVRPCHMSQFAGTDCWIPGFQPRVEGANTTQRSRSKPALTHDMTLNTNPNSVDRTRSKQA